MITLEIVGCESDGSSTARGWSCIDDCSRWSDDLPQEVIAGPCFEGVDEVEHINDDDSVPQSGIGGVVIGHCNCLRSSVDIAGECLAIGSVDAGEGGSGADGDKLRGECDDDGGGKWDWQYGSIESEIDWVELPIDGEGVGGGKVD